MAKPQTIASAKWNKKAGYKTKGFNLRGELLDEFAAACKAAGVSQASVIADAMRAFIAANNPTADGGER